MKSSPKSQTSVERPRSTGHKFVDEVPMPEATREFKQSRMTTPEALRLLRRQFRELMEYFSYYVTAKADSAKLRLRNTLLWAALCTLVFVVICGFFMIAGWFMLNGVAAGLGVFFGDRPWLGNLVTGFVSSVGLGCAMYCVVVKWMSSHRGRTIQKYAERQARQQTEFGHGIHDQRAETPSTSK